ncbi:MAG: type II toxin-antitoxin system HicB family antitoxin [Mariprofundales bacterium]|nr:type II toxin-antitoxin system HicB family antitoxin [Mariprofundales bacterium]
MHRYEIIIHWSEADGIWIAEAPELLGCMAHGASDAEALSNIHVAMALWLDSAAEDGVPIPQPCGHRLMYA